MTKVRTLGVRAALVYGVAAIVLAGGGVRARATGVPVDGFLPMVGITLTDEFVHDIDFFPYPSAIVEGTPLSLNGQQRYDVALLDTGAATSLLTTAADAAFNIDGPYSGESDGFRGTESITIGGATGFLEASIGDPLGLYASGLQNRTSSGSSLGMNVNLFQGQTNTSLVTLPVESDLPNVLGLSFASQYATRIRNSAPQIFELEGKTIRTPAVDFLPLGTGNTYGISRKAPLNVSGDSPSTPILFPNIANFDLDKPWENPSSPTVVQGGHFLNVNVANDSSTLSNEQFFFDTGASVTVLSELTALQLGIDVQLDAPDFTIQIVGSGGISEAVPGYYIDQLTVLATGGSVTLNSVPVLVFDVTNPADPGNVVPGIVGTNVFAGRDIIIDPNPSLGGGGPSAGVYISDPVTTTRTWASTAASAAWSTASSWSGSTVPTITGIANVRHVAGGNQTATITGAALAWEANISGAGAAERMNVQIGAGAKLTTFSGVNVEAFGGLKLQGGTLDAQYVEVQQGGILSGSGEIRTGSGPIVGQVENNDGTVIPGDNGTGTLVISGRFSNSSAATLAFTLSGSTPGEDFGQLVVEGPAAWGGTLAVDFEPGFTPLVGESFVLATYASQGGLFDALSLPLSGLIDWGLDYGDNELTLTVLGPVVPGDFNFNGVVGAGDLAAWRASYSATGTDGGDFLAWQRLQHGGPGIGAVPEPTAAGLMLLAACALRRRPWRRAEA